MIRYCRILVINNDEALSRYLREKLIISGGFDVSFKNSVREGLEAFTDNNFDVVLAHYLAPDAATQELV